MSKWERIETISTEEDLLCLMMGGAFLGSGGGGPMNMALDLKDYILSFKKAIRVIPPEALETADKSCGAITAFMGSPEAGSHGLDMSTPGNAFCELERIVAGQKMDFSLLIEIGALNSLVPFSVAARNDIPVVDCDGAGRAVPKLQNTTYAQTVSVVPAALANGARPGYPTIGNIIDLKDVPWDSLAETFEDYALDILAIKSFGQVGGLAAYITKGPDVVSCTVNGTVSLSYGIGKRIRDCLGLGKDVPQGIIAYLNDIGLAHYLFGGGTVTEVHRPSGDSANGNLDVGYVIVTDKMGNQLKVSYENENLYAVLNGVPWAMAPDLICYAGPMGACSNVEIQEGQQISVIGVAANGRIRTDAIVTSFMNELKRLGLYDGPYVPIERLHAE